MKEFRIVERNLSCPMKIMLQIRRQVVQQALLGLCNALYDGSRSLSFIMVGQVGLLSQSLEVRMFHKVGLTGEEALPSGAAQMAHHTNTQYTDSVSWRRAWRAMTLVGLRTMPGWCPEIWQAKRLTRSGKAAPYFVATLVHTANVWEFMKKGGCEVPRASHQVPSANDTSHESHSTLLSNQFA